MTSLNTITPTLGQSEFGISMVKIPIIYKIHCIFDRAEHRSHSPNCSFAKKGKPQGKLTVEEFMKMEMDSQQNRIVCK